MFVGLVDTRKPEPEPEEEREPLLERIPELRPWRWFVADHRLHGGLRLHARLGDRLSSSTAGLCCFFQALTSYYKGNDGLSQHRQ